MNKQTALPLSLLLAVTACLMVAALAPDAHADAAEPEDTRDALTALIDREIDAVLKRDDIRAAALSDDEEFLRRVYLDTVGVPPTRDEYRAFMADERPDKRAILIDSLLADPRFGRHMGDLWGNIIVGRTGRDASAGNHLFALWVSEQINDGASFRDIIYEIVTARGDLSSNPAVFPLTRLQPFRVADAAGNLTRTLTGVQIQCAECHDHPYEDAWTEQTFNGVASFFSPVRVANNIQSFPRNPVVTDNPTRPRLPRAAGGNLPPQAQARIAEAMRYNNPATLDGREVLTDDRLLWRRTLAQWMTNRENTQTAAYVANRFWSFAFGSGIVNPPDDFNSFNEPSHPELLNALALDLIEHNYDIRRLYSAILNSQTYQRTSRNPDPRAERWHFAHAPVRQLTPEQFFAALTGFADDQEIRVMRTRGDGLAGNFRRVAERRRDRMEQAEQPNRRFDAEALDRYVAWFERMDDTWWLRRNMAANYSRATSDDEMTEADAFTLSIDQALAVMNGNLTQSITSSRPGSLIATVLRRERDDVRRLEELFIAMLSRRPTEAEQEYMLKYVSDQGGARGAWEDILYALLASTEFATNH
jgi:hypothetical protein